MMEEQYKLGENACVQIGLKAIPTPGDIGGLPGEGAHFHELH
jgi:hypothetical protein